MPEQSRFRSPVLTTPKAGFSFGNTAPVQNQDKDKTPPDAMAAVMGAHMAPGSVSSHNLALVGNGGVAPGTLVTADTTSYNTVTYAEFQIMGKRTTCWFPFSLTTKHTVNYAFYNIAMYLYKGTNAALGAFVAYPFVGYQELPGTAGNVDTISGTGGIDIGISTTDAGPHVLYLTVRNLTAGTITSGVANNSSDFVGYYQFGY